MKNAGVFIFIYRVVSLFAAESNNLKITLTPLESLLFGVWLRDI